MTTFAASIKAARLGTARPIARTRDLDKDIGRGRFEGRTLGNLVSKLVKGLQQFREANESSSPRLFDNLYEYLKTTGGDSGCGRRGR